jgi:SNF2 family DNA or RNA helicase
MSQKKKLKLHTRPWKHQLPALKYFMPRNYGALYTSCGSGKTKIMLDLIRNRGFKKTVIVATTKICKRQVWEKEINKHIKVGLFSTYSVFFIPGKQRRTYILEKEKSDNIAYKVLIVNYESIWRKPFRDFLLKWGVDCVICDESHKIKSPNSKTSKYLALLGKRVKNRFLMTGTPLGQSPLDVYAQYRFLQPSIFGTSYYEFKHKYANWKLKDNYEVINKKNPYKNLEELTKKMYSCAFAQKVEDTLPPEQEIIVNFELSTKVQRYDKTIRKEGGLETNSGHELLVDNILTTLIRRQQLVAGYLPVEENKVLKVDNSRQETFKELLEGIPKTEPVVVIAKYKKEIKDIKQVAKELGRKSSELSGREDTVDDWLRNKTTVLVMQISTGAEGLNELVKARYCIYYSLSHSVTNYIQSKKRIRREGQKRPVVYYYIISKMSKGLSVDELIFKSLKSNMNVIDYIHKNGRSL